MEPTLGISRQAQGPALCLVPPTERSAVTWDPEGVATGTLGKDGNSEESFPAKAGGLGVPPGCKCPKRETVGVGWASSAALTDEAGQLQGPKPGGLESSDPAGLAQIPCKKRGNSQATRCQCGGDLGHHPGCSNSLPVALAPFPN